jgi:pyruvate/2-oxoglutarate dehydrogenase complex dihydrolipoamide dehydrogenase (E3) component
MESFDFVVIGGGSAGYAAATAGARFGLKTVCIEGGKKLGGTCVLKGCMPSKTFIESANRFLTLRRAKEFGLSAGHVAFDAEEIVQRKRKFVTEFGKHRGEQLMGGGFGFIRGQAEFIDSHHLKVKLLSGGEEEIEGKTFLICTGSAISSTNLEGLAETGFLDSDTALDSDHYPRSLVVLGGGAIALEFAHFYNALGLEVTVLQRSPQVLAKDADRDIAEALVEAFRKRGMKVHCGTQLKRVGRTANGKSVWYEQDGEERVVEADQIFYALGRKPAVAGLGLKKAGVDTNPKNHDAVIVNDKLQTSQPHIFGGGDVTGLYDIVHIAAKHGEIAAENANRLLEGKPGVTMDYRLIMVAVFSEPQVAVVGLTERKAVEQGLEVRVAKHWFDDHGKSMVRGETDGFVKLIVDAKSGEIVGGAVVGPEGSELIHEIAVAMHFHSTAADLASVPHYHPTLSEIWTYPAEELALVNARSR